MTRAFRALADFLHNSYAYLAMLLGLDALALIGLMGLPLALVLMCLPASTRIPLGRKLISGSFRAYLVFLKCFCSVRIDASALDLLRQDRPLIVVANHPSLLDAVVLLAGLPHTVCVMKGSLGRSLLFGPMSRLSGYITNDDPMGLIRQACDELAAGSQILIFPEGTRTRQFPVNPFGEATAFISARSGVAVQTLLIDFSSPYLGKTWPLLKKPQLPLSISVRLGRRFESEQGRLALTEQLESYYRSQLKR